MIFINKSSIESAVLNNAKSDNNLLLRVEKKGH